MSATRSWTIHCDSCGASDEGDLGATTARERRAELKMSGWHTNLNGGRDLCGACWDKGEFPAADMSSGDLAELANLIHEHTEMLGDILAELRLYVDWRYCTKQLTRLQKEVWCDVIRTRGGTPDRWWDDSPDAVKGMLEEAVSAIRAVIHDRPTAHSDAVWQRMLTIIDKYEEFTDASR